MKSKIIIIFFALALTACKTTSGPVGQVSTRRHREFPEPSFAEFAQPTNQRDTLYLVKDDSMSILTKDRSSFTELPERSRKDCSNNLPSGNST